MTRYLWRDITQIIFYKMEAADVPYIKSTKTSLWLPCSIDICQIIDSLLSMQKTKIN